MVFGLLENESSGSEGLAGSDSDCEDFVGRYTKIDDNFLLLRSVRKEDRLIASNEVAKLRIIFERVQPKTVEQNEEAVCEVVNGLLDLFRVHYRKESV